MLSQQKSKPFFRGKITLRNHIWYGFLGSKPLGEVSLRKVRLQKDSLYKVGWVKLY